MKKNTILSSAILVSFLVSIMLVSPVSAATVGLVAEWNLDEGSGSIAYDSTANGNDGVLSGGKFGNALYFDGLDDYVSLGSNVFSDSDLATYTLEVWINIDSLDSVERRIFDDEGGLRPMLNSGNKLQAFHWDSTAWTGKTVTMAITPTVGVWYHIAQTYDGVNMKFYVNNGLVGSIASAAWEPDGLNRDANIGTIWNDLGRYWKGLIDEVRLSNTAKTSFTLNAAPEVELGVTVALWHFDDSEGTTLSDASGNGYDGIIHGATWAGPTWTAGYSGSALDFDGKDDYVWMSDDPSLDFGAGDSFTLEAWIKTSDSSTGYNNIIRKDNYVMGEPRALWLIAVYNPGGKLRGFLYDVSGNYLFIESSITVNDGIWHHVAFVRDAVNDELRLYIDYNEDPAIPVTDSTTDTLENAGWCAFGAYANPKRQGEFFDGIIDEVKIYNYALTGLNLEFDPASDSIAPLNTDANIKVCLKDAYENTVEGMTVTLLPSAGLTLSSVSGTTGTDGCYAFTAKSADTGVYTITATVSTVAGDFSDTWTLAIYEIDPNAGFVTGGGWIYSPAGAYAADTSLEGKATFGFVSKYKKGAAVPTGNTEFVFHAGDFKFSSTSYDWLVIAGTKAIFKGEGEVNGEAGYKFMLTADDGGKTGVDTFRIKITHSDAIVYDNGAQSPLGGGSIIVHTK